MSDLRTHPTYANAIRIFDERASELNAPSYFIYVDEVNAEEHPLGDEFMAEHEDTETFDVLWFYARDEPFSDELLSTLEEEYRRTPFGIPTSRMNQPLYFLLDGVVFEEEDEGEVVAIGFVMRE